MFWQAASWIPSELSAEVPHHGSWETRGCAKLWEGVEVKRQRAKYAWDESSSNSVRLAVSNQLQTDEASWQMKIQKLQTDEASWQMKIQKPTTN